MDFCEILQGVEKMVSMLIIGAMLGSGFGALIMYSIADLLSLPPNPWGGAFMIFGGIAGAVLGAEFMRRNM